MTNQPAAPSVDTNRHHELAPWRSPLSRALHRNRSQPFCRFLQLATLRTDGTPANRTIVFRGFLDTLAAQGNQLTFISDRRSEKTQQIQQNPDVEICWYFTKTREQFRISGQMTIVTAEATTAELKYARRQTWQKISEKARQQFDWPHPKAARTEDAEFDVPFPNEKEPLPDFSLLLLAPHTVDYLNLRGNPQDRVIYTRSRDKKEQSSTEHTWTTSLVNP